MLATFTLPLGLIVVLAHNIWIWGIPVIVTVIGWAMILKSLFYLFVPRAHVLVMQDGPRIQRGFGIAGGGMIFLGALLAYDSFYKQS